MEKIIAAISKIKGSAKGQIAIPQHIREEMGYSSHAEFRVEYRKGRDQIILTRQRIPAESFFGILSEDAVRRRARN